MIGLEQLADGSPADRNFHLLDTLVPDTGGKSLGIRQGTASVVWPGGARLTTALTVTHGLGKTPTTIQLTSSSSNMHLSYSNFTTTTFDVTGNTMDGTSPVATTARSFSWLAIG